MWGSGSFCSDSVFSLKGGFGTVMCPLLVWLLVSCEDVMTGATAVILWRWGEPAHPLHHMQRLADQANGKNLGHPDSTGQLRSLILETQPTSSTSWLTAIGGQTFFSCWIALFGFPLPTAKASWLIHLSHAVRNGSRVLLEDCIQQQTHSSCLLHYSQHTLCLFCCRNCLLITSWLLLPMEPLVPNSTDKNARNLSQ